MRVGQEKNGLEVVGRLRKNRGAGYGFSAVGLLRIHDLLVRDGSLQHQVSLLDRADSGRRRSQSLVVSRAVGEGARFHDILAATFVDKEGPCRCGNHQLVGSTSMYL